MSTPTLSFYTNHIPRRSEGLGKDFPRKVAGVFPAFPSIGESASTFHIRIRNITCNKEYHIQYDPNRSYKSWSQDIQNEIHSIKSMQN